MFSEDRPQLTQPQTGPTRDQRKHIRLEHSGTVQFISEGQQFSGQAVNISRSGMQVVVNVPDSYQSVRSITFTLPHSEQAIELPCRIVRSESGNGGDEAQVLGLEFSYQGEAQLLLIENFIREMKKTDLAEPSQSSEMRQIPRADCSIRNVLINRDGVKVHSIDNISSEGLLISFRGDLNPGELVELSFCLPGDKRRLELAGSITYIIRNDFQELCSAGLRLIDPKETHQARIRNFIVAATSTTAIKSLCDRFHKKKSDGEHSIGNRENIVQLFKDILHDGKVLNVLLEDQLVIYESKLQKLHEAEDEFELFVP
ncbi:MAG: PilZ domain-containing protein, partial [Spirochaetales bacterium]|nr:PilZ domain-containing protein [Spirochaetales bacterium]